MASNGCTPLQQAVSVKKVVVPLLVKGFSKDTCEPSIKRARAR
jgi:hypothetical protein